MRLISIHNGLWIFILLFYDARASIESRSTLNHNCVDLIPKALLKFATDIGSLGLHGPSPKKRLKSLTILKSEFCENSISRLGNCELQTLANLVMLPNPFAFEIFLIVRHIKCVWWLGPELRKRDIEHQCTSYHSEYYLPKLLEAATRETLDDFEGAKELVEHGLLLCMELEEIDNFRPWLFREEFQLQILSSQITGKLRSIEEKTAPVQWFYKEIARRPKKRARTITLLVRHILMKPLLVQNLLLMRRVCLEVITGIRDAAINPCDWMIEGGTPLLIVLPKIQEFVPQLCLQNNNEDSQTLPSSLSFEISLRSMDKQGSVDKRNNKAITGLEEDPIDNLVEKISQLKVDEDSTSEESPSMSKSLKMVQMKDDLILHGINFFATRDSSIPLAIMENPNITIEKLLSAFDFACLITKARNNAYSDDLANKAFKYLIKHFKTPLKLAMNLWRHGCRHLLILLLDTSTFLFEPSLLVKIFSHQADTEMLTFASILYDVPDLIDTKSITNPVFSFICLLQKSVYEAYRKLQLDQKTVRRMFIDLKNIADDFTATECRYLLRIILLFVANVNLDKTAHLQKTTGKFLSPEKMQIELNSMIISLFGEGNLFDIILKTMPQPPPSWETLNNDYEASMSNNERKPRFRSPQVSRPLLPRYSAYSFASPRQANLSPTVSITRFL